MNSLRQGEQYISWSFPTLNLFSIFFYPKDLGLNTTWDDELSYILTPALAAYELEHSTGVSAGNEEFQQAIRRAIPDGHTFKGFPIQFVHRNARRAFATCLRWAIRRITWMRLSGGVRASWLVHPLDRVVWVRALAGSFALSSWARDFTLTGPLSTQVYKWVPTNLMLG